MGEAAEGHRPPLLQGWRSQPSINDGDLFYCCFCGPGRCHFDDHFDDDFGVFFHYILDTLAHPKWGVLGESPVKVFGSQKPQLGSPGGQEFKKLPQIRYVGQLKPNISQISPYIHELPINRTAAVMLM